MIFRLQKGENLEKLISRAYRRCRVVVVDKEIFEKAKVIYGYYSR
ncbi:MAG: hypothetical protein QW478_15875 [Candidatus Micrarchaeaceae archaeon]